MARQPRKLIPLKAVHPGQYFEHYRDQFVRATEAEIPRHPGKSLLDERGVDRVILTYMLPAKGQSGRTPVSFNADEKVLVKAGKK
jgi:hypothetical protein